MNISDVTCNDTSNVFFFHFYILAMKWRSLRMRCCDNGQSNVWISSKTTNCSCNQTINFKVRTIIFALDAGDVCNFINGRPWFFLFVCQTYANLLNWNWVSIPIFRLMRDINDGYFIPWWILENRNGGEIAKREFVQIFIKYLYILCRKLSRLTLKYTTI